MKWRVFVKILEVFGICNIAIIGDPSAANSKTMES